MAKFLDETGLKKVLTKVREYDNNVLSQANAKLAQELVNYPKLEGTKIPSSYLPSYVDDVIDGYFNPTTSRFYKNSAFTEEIGGEAGKIYVDTDTNKVYRYTGILAKQFVEISSSLALGETSSTAYAGDKGAKNAENIAALQTNVSGLQTDVSGLQTDVSAIKSNYVEVNNLSSNILGQVYNSATSVGMEISNKVGDNWITRSQVRLDEDHLTLGAFNDVYIGYIEEIGEGDQHKFSAYSESVYINGSDNINFKVASSSRVILSEGKFIIGEASNDVNTECHGTLTVNGNNVWNSESLVALSTSEIDTLISEVEDAK